MPSARNSIGADGLADGHVYVSTRRSPNYNTREIFRNGHGRGREQVEGEEVGESSYSLETLRDKK